MSLWQTGHTFLSSESSVLTKSNIADDAGALVVGDVADGDATIGSSGGDDAGCGGEDQLLGRC